MAGEKLSPAMVKNISPNLGVMMKIVTATSDDNADYVDMGDYNFTTVYAAWAVDVTANAAITCTIGSSNHVIITGTAGETTILVVGV